MTAIFVVLVAAIVAGVFWLGDKGLAWWWILAGVVIVVVFIIFSFLAYRKVAIERDRYKQEVGKKESQLKQAQLQIQSCTLAVEFFEQRQTSEWWGAKIRSARNIWAMYLIGGRTHNDELLKSANFGKLVLLHPENMAVKAIKELESKKTVEDLQENIRNLTRFALGEPGKHCKVHWCKDIAYSLITIGNAPSDKDSPPPNDMWVYVETYVPGIEAAARPGFFVERAKNQELADRMLLSFNKLWEYTKPPDSLRDSHTEDSQP